MIDPRLQRRIFAVTLVVFPILLSTLLVILQERGERDPQARFEAQLTRRGRRLVRALDPAPKGCAARDVHVGRRTLAGRDLYCRNSDDRRQYILLDAAGRFHLPGRDGPALKNGADLLLGADGLALFVDGRPTLRRPGRWELFWVVKTDRAPRLAATKYPEFYLSDGFMRTRLEESYWKVSSGTWELKQRGGGLPADAEQAHNYNVQRAVNPFSVTGEGSGVLTYGEAPRPNCHVEARFYMGIPRTGRITDTNTLPTGTDMLLILGALDGEQVAWGWRGAVRTFVLMRRRANGPWRPVYQWEGKRPPITNWFKLGMDLELGARVRVFLDGVEVCAQELDARINGPLHVGCGKAPMEFDDVAAWSLPAPPLLPQKLFVMSRNFADKKIKPHSDPEQFSEWARSADVFFKDPLRLAGHERVLAITSRVPIFHDLTYESVHSDPECGELQPGIYEFRLMTKDPADPFDLQKLKSAFAFRMAYSREGWQAVDLPETVWPKGHKEFTLQWRWRGDDPRGVAVKVNGRFVPISGPVHGPVHFSVGKVLTSGDAPTYPWPEHHCIRSRHLVNEFFEQAPTAWNWIEGSFRMADRWACQNQWNFMACGSTGVPYMAGKRTFAGDQEHDFFMSLRPVYPWDAGDSSFAYDPSVDSGWQVFIANHGWYNRHDLNFSWCTDGRNPLSGYALVFAGDDNTETRLLRKGRVVARTTDFYIPRDESHHVVHWKWWRFSVRQYGGRIQVHMNGGLVFDYTDPRPLTGGHIGWWGIRNGFTVARSSSVAARLGSEPHVFYVADDAASPWQPLWRDAVTLVHRDGPRHTRVVANSGAGFQAVRFRFAKPVDLRATPLLDLPFKVGPGARVNLHLCISDRSYVVQVNAPLEKTQALLTPEFEKGEQFQLPLIPLDEIRSSRLLAQVKGDGAVHVNLLDLLKKIDPAGTHHLLSSITVGNGSNQDYLLAGSTANRCGASYELGTPVLSKSPTK